MPQSSIAGKLILEWLDLTGIRQETLASEYQMSKEAFNLMLHNSSPGHKHSLMMSVIMNDKRITRDKLDELRKSKEQAYDKETKQR
ncbi:MULTISPECIES: hypothetical protein [unclassified Lactococcus]|uniref:hypothetical protein n=1 Tax=unclassified Lactococcus TaxID=2643510 RepID=UPI0011CB9B20|nr:MULTISPECIES: hypothetical protein [unclassified Lactococcus]MQW23920.1 hypothetical protein [Lactococcus sp. dk101]TXK37146.1 hypothetical protein FVP42_09870 [Lactococcus sp. dk310]TXK48000.1 hypothetical protein FVP43_09595 [Lactococcus sp. dk322]